MKKTQTYKNAKFYKPGVNYYLGLDMGVSSIGWAVMKEIENPENNEQKYYLHDFGVRLFDFALNDNSNKSSTEIRRTYRGQRRTIRRRVYRIAKVKKILAKNNFYTFEEFQKTSNEKETNLVIPDGNEFKTKPGFWNIYALKNKGLNQKLTKNELFAVLINYCKKRGYLDRFSFENSLSEEEKSKATTSKKTKTGKFNTALNDAEKILQKYGYISTAILKDPQFHIQKSNQILIHAKNSLITYDNKKNSNEKKEKKTKSNNQKINYYRFLFSREEYRKEAEAILQNQIQYYPKLKLFQNELIDTIFNQRFFEDGPKCQNCRNKDYKNCNRNACSKYDTFINMIGKCSNYPNEPRKTKASIAFGIYYYIGEISKLLAIIEKNEKPFDKKFYQNLLLWLILQNFNNKKNEVIKEEIKIYLEQQPEWNKTYNNYFKSPIWENKINKKNKIKFDKKSGINFDKNTFWNIIYEIEPLRNILQKSFTFDDSSQINSKDLQITITNNPLNKLGEILHENITPERRKNKLINFFEEHKLTLNDKEIKTIVRVGSEATTTANVSEKLMLKAVEYFWNGEIPSKKIAIEFQSDKCVIKKNHFGRRIFDKLIDWDLVKNPIVFRAVNQTRKVLKALHKEYGFFKNINIEVAREIGGKFKELRQLIDQKHQIDNEKRNQQIKDALKQVGIHDNTTNLKKWKLWETQEKICLYCHKEIFEDDFNNRNLEVDHIIPQSQWPDDSEMNRVLVHRTCNQAKGNLIPYQYLTTTNKNSIKYSEFKKKIIQNKKLSQKKKDYLLTKNINDLASDFFSRDLNDTRYMTKYISSYIKQQLQHKPFGLSELKSEVLTIKGWVTSKLRKQWLKGSPWGLEKKVRDLTPFHHAVDAMIIAQFKNLWDIQATFDVLEILHHHKRIQNTNNDAQKKEREVQLQEICKTKKNHWEKLKNNKKFNNIDSIINRIQKQINDAQHNSDFNLSLKIKNLKQQIENRIPVILDIKECSCLNKKNAKSVESKNQNTDETMEKKQSPDFCNQCFNAKKYPFLFNNLNKQEWQEKQKSIHDFDKNKINLRYPMVSYMVNYKIKGSWGASKFGFKSEKTGTKSLKQQYYRIWKKFGYINDTNNVENLPSEKLEKWQKIFKEKKGFICNPKTGNIVETNKYYGLLLPENNSNDRTRKWLSVIDALQTLKREKKQTPNLSKHWNNWKRSQLLVHNVAIEYNFKKRKRQIAIYRSKKSDSPRYYLCIHPINLKRTYGKEKYYIDSETNIIKNNDYKILKIDILGNVLN